MTHPLAEQADRLRGLPNSPEMLARELLAEGWGDHPQWQNVRDKILTGSCSIHSDVVSLSCSIALKVLQKYIASEPTRIQDRERVLREETGWLIEEDAGGFTHWIALTTDQWPRRTYTTRRDRMNSDLDVEIMEYKPAVRRVKDADEALRFARKADAEAFMVMFDRFLLNPVATEHQWPIARTALATLPTGEEA